MHICRVASLVAQSYSGHTAVDLIIHCSKFSYSGMKGAQPSDAPDLLAQTVGDSTHLAHPRSTRAGGGATEVNHRELGENWSYLGGLNQK